MESRAYDPTLPLDFNGSTNLGDLPEVTIGLGNTISDHDLQESLSGSTSSGHGLLLPSPMLAKAKSGRMSPVRGRTMKEYDQQITELKKENFSLKLRIYFLEERMQQKYGDGEDVFKTNIELKVNVQSLKKELEDKQELLRKASQAMEMLTSSQESDIDSVRKSLEDQHHRYTEELRKDLQKALQDAEDAHDEMKENQMKMQQLEVQLQQVEMEQQQSLGNIQKLKDTIEMKEREVSAMQLESDSQARSLDDLQHLLRDAEEQRDAAKQRVEKMEKDLQRRGRDVEQLSEALKDASFIDGQSFLAPTHLQDAVDDQRDNLAHLEAKVAELEDQLENKDNALGKLEDGLKEKDKAWKEATNRLQQLTSELEDEKKLGTRRDKTIQGLVTSLHKKEKEVTSAKAKLSKSETALKTARAELHEAEMANHQDDPQPLQEQLAESEASNHRLMTQLEEANAEVESMIKSLGKKEGELAGFKEQLQKATQALQRSEDALELLQDQLEKERSQANTRLDKQAQEFQRTVEDYMKQLEGKDSLMAHMTSQMHSKDQQLTSLMDLLTDEDNKGQKALLQRLEDDLNKSSTTAQNALEEKQTELEQKGRELREARQALHEKGKELEQANLHLLDKQQELEKLDLRHQQQTTATANLSAALTRAQNSLEEALDRHAQALEEKDAMMQRLQKKIMDKERMLEELSNQSPSNDKLNQQLRAQLREKDQLIQELQTDCVRAQCDREQAARSFQSRLQEAEEQIQVLDGKHRKDLANRDQEIQELMAQLARKDLQLSALQSRLNDAEEQQRDALQVLRKTLAEKDKTIEALVDSVGEKERLLRRSQQNLTEDAKAQLAEMDTLLAENSRLKRQLREKEAELDALQKDGWQKNHLDNRESHHTSYHETITHNNVDNAKVCHLLEEQIRETHALNDLLRQDRHSLLVNLHDNQQCYHGHDREEGASAKDGHKADWDQEAAAALQRLQEGVDRYQQLHQSLLEVHANRNTDRLTTSGESIPEGDHHHFHNSPHQRSSVEQDGCPSISTSTSVSACSRNRSPITATSRQAGDGTPAAAVSGRAGAQRNHSLGVQTSPLALHSLLTQVSLLPQDRSVDRGDNRAAAGAGEGETTQPHLSFDRERALDHLQGEASQTSVSSASSLCTAAELAVMSAAVLRDLVSQLQEDLIAAAQRNTMLQSQLNTMMHPQRNGISAASVSADQLQGKNGASSVSDLMAQMQLLKDKLKLKDEETARLQQHLGITSYPGNDSRSFLPSNQSPQVSDLQGQVCQLRQQVKDMNKVNSSLKDQMARAASSVEQQEGSGLQQREKDTLRAGSSSLAPSFKELDVKGSDEGVEKNKKAGTSAMTQGLSFQEFAYDGNGSFCPDLSRNTNRHADSSVSQTSGLESEAPLTSDVDWAPRVMGKSGEGQAVSRLSKMKLNTTDTSCNSLPLVNMTHRLQESRERVKHLETQLQATEGTVRYMSQRMRHYRSLLKAANSDAADSGPLPQRHKVSLSLSCSDLREAAQSPGGSVGVVRDSSDVPAVLSPSRLDSPTPHSVLSTLNQHIQTLRQRYSQDPEEVNKQQGSRWQVARQPSTGQEEEDGGSNLSHISPGSCSSREVMRRKPEYQQQRSGAFGGGEDVLDSTMFDNLTYSSFSESIMPLDIVPGYHNDSAWSLPQGLKSLHLTAEQAARLGKDERKTATSQGQGGKLGDQTTLDSTALDSRLSFNISGSQESPQSESSRLKTKVAMLSSVNRTLREELSIYDTLCRSFGVQVTPEGVGVGSGESSKDESCDGEMKLLQLHLAELKRLRSRMEQLDTDAHNAVQVTALLNDQHLRRISELEMTLADLRDQLAQRQHSITEHEVIRKHQETETQLLRDNLAALQECETQRAHHHEAEISELKEKLGVLTAELRVARDQAKAAQQRAQYLEEELEEVRSQSKSYDLRLSESQQHLQDLETQLSKARRRCKAAEDSLRVMEQRVETLESDLTESHDQQAVLKEKLQEAEKLHLELLQSKTRVHNLQEEVERLRRESQELVENQQAGEMHCKQLETQLNQALHEKRELQSLQEEVEQARREDEESFKAGEKRCRQLEMQLNQVLQEKRELQTQSSESSALEEECRQQSQRAQHYQERMAHYEQCMREYQQRVHDCEEQVQQLQTTLQSSQSKELDAEKKLKDAAALTQSLQAQVKDAESRAHTNESIAHRADTLARTLEGRLRELEAKVKESEDRARDSEYELRVSQSTSTEINITVETLKREAQERSAKLKKRDAQLKKLVEEYKKLVEYQKETSQLNQTLKTEVKLYESMHCQTQVGSDKKEELMRQLLSELSQTRRLAEDLITRMENNKRNDSPASTGGLEATDGRPSPELRDSLHRLMQENTQQMHSDNHSSTTESQASFRSDQSGGDVRLSESPPVSEESVRYGSSSDAMATRSKMLIGGRSSPLEINPSNSSSTQSIDAEMSAALRGDSPHYDKDGGGGSLRKGLGHSQLHTSLKYWQDRPNASMSLPSGGPRVEVDSDVRRLFAISGLEGYEKLRRENGELLATLSSMQARISDRLKTFAGVSISESVEYSTLRELQMSAQNLRICAEEEGRLLSCFWLTQLPPLNARGEFYDPKMAEENENLWVEIRKQKSRYDLLVNTVREQQERLHATNALRKKWETTLYKQLGHTTGMLEKAKENFDDSGLSPTKGRSPQKSPFKDKN